MINKFSDQLWQLGYSNLVNLRDEEFGFRASEAVTGYYNTLFGRDSLWILLFLLKTLETGSSQLSRGWVEEAGATVLHSLCRFQGQIYNPVNEEQPGKIIHEYRERIDERLRNMRLGFVDGRLYSGFDQTFLFITAYRQFSKIFPENPVVAKAWRNVELALGWIKNYADSDGDGLFEYCRRNPNNLPNQVWKDSFDSITGTGVDVPLHPIAWIEVQAYAYHAFMDASDLYDEREDKQTSLRFSLLAEKLRQNVNDKFWIEDDNCFAIALSGEKEKIELISSNVGHALWADLVVPERKDAVVTRLMQSDITTRYGLRTLSSLSSSYAPFAYHRGCIWPFDNAIFIMGLMDNGYRDEALRLARGVGEALKKIGSPIELYIVLDADIFLEPELHSNELLALRRSGQENRNQGWTAAALLYFAAILSQDT